MTKKSPKVSVIMPVFNVIKYLEKSLDSVLNQTLEDIEIICGDGGSTDGSLELLREYENKNSRLFVISKVGSGYGQSMNDCVKASTGEYIGIVETDDFIDPSMYESLYQAAKRYDADIVKSDFYCFIDDKKGSPVNWKIKSAVSNNFYNRVFAPRNELRSFRCCLNTWCGIYRREFLLENQIWHNETPGGSYQDNGFWFQSFSLAERVVFIPKAFYHYRQDNENASVKNSGKIFCICDEYNFIEEKMKAHENIFAQVYGAFLVAKIGAYTHTLQRISPEYREVFLNQMKKDFEKIDFLDLKISKLFSGREKKFLQALKNENNPLIFKPHNAFISAYWCILEHGLGFTVGKFNERLVRCLTSKHLI